MITNRTRDDVLGVMRGPDALYAVLVEQTDTGPVIRFSIPPTPLSAADSDDRGEGRAGEMQEAPPTGTAPVIDEQDVTIQFGETEDEGVSEVAYTDIDDWARDADTISSFHAVRGFLPTLDALLRDCAARGYDDPDLAFCAPFSEVDSTELQIPKSTGPSVSDDHDSVLPTSRTVLLELLEKKYGEEIEAERVAFLPMSAAADGTRRVLALVSSATGSIPVTLSAMPDRTWGRGSRVKLLETEVSLYHGWAQSALGSTLDASEKSLVVRVGTENTLLLFLKGSTIEQVDTLPSLTVDDPADTICSRVLLYQDEYGMGDVRHILLVGEGDESGLVDGFEPYFSRTNIHLLREEIPYDADQAQSGLHVAALGAALRHLGDAKDTMFFSPVNLLGSEHRRSIWPRSLGTMEAAVFALLFFVTTLAFGWFYLSNAEHIEQKQEMLRALERQTASVDQDRLKARVDSLETVVAEHSEDLNVLDNLLRGSNKWSRGLAELAAHAGAVEGLSIDEWRPQSDSHVRISGRSTARARVVELTRRLDGEVKRLTFTEVRDWPLYAFEITMPLDLSSPEAVVYWQKEHGALANSDSVAEEASVSRPSMAEDVSGLRDIGPPDAEIPVSTARAVSRSSGPDEPRTAFGPPSSAP